MVRPDAMRGFDGSIGLGAIRNVYTRHFQDSRMNSIRIFSDFA